MTLLATVSNVQSPAGPAPAQGSSSSSSSKAAWDASDGRHVVKSIFYGNFKETLVDALQNPDQLSLEHQEYLTIFLRSRPKLFTENVIAAIWQIFKKRTPQETDSRTDRFLTIVAYTIARLHEVACEKRAVALNTKKAQQQKQKKLPKEFSKAEIMEIYEVLSPHVSKRVKRTFLNYLPYVEREKLESLIPLIQRGDISLVAAVKELDPLFEEDLDFVQREKLKYWVAVIKKLNPLFEDAVVSNTQPLAGAAAAQESSASIPWGGRHVARPVFRGNFKKTLVDALQNPDQLSLELQKDWTVFLRSRPKLFTENVIAAIWQIFKKRTLQKTNEITDDFLTIVAYRIAGLHEVACKKRAVALNKQKRRKLPKEFSKAEIMEIHRVLSLHASERVKKIFLKYLPYVYVQREKLESLTRLIERKDIPVVVAVKELDPLFEGDLDDAVKLFKKMRI